MIWRLVAFLGLQLAGALLVAMLAEWISPGHAMAGALAGAIAAGSIWLALDMARGDNVLRWLSSGDVLETSARYGLWGEVAARARKLIEQRDEETQLARSQLAAFLAAIQASPNGVMILDARSHIEWSNQTAAEQFGIDAARDKLQPIVNLIRDPAFIDYFHREDFTRDVVINAKQQPASRPKRVSVQLHPYGEGSRLLITRDVTAIEQADAMRRDFVANVSHEIRTPLTVLAGFVETMQTLPLGEADRQKYLGLMASQSARMQSLVADLLTLSQLEGSPPPGLDESLDVPSLMARLQTDTEALSKIVTGHGVVAREQTRLTKQAARHDPHAVVIYDVPLLFEAGIDTRVDATVVVSTDRETQIARLKTRNGLSRAEALRRINSQLPMADKRRRADYVLDGTLPLPALRKQVGSLLRLLRASA